MPDNHENTYKELLIYLQNIDVSFVIVEVNEPARQEAIVAELTAALSGRKITTVNLQDTDVSTGYLTEIRKHIDINPSVEILLILNIHKVKMESADDATALLTNMNLSRELYLKLNKVLVFFLPTYFVDLVIKTAKDFFSYVSITFKFLDVDKQPFMELSSPEEYFNEQEVNNRILFLENTLNTYKLTERERGKVFYDLGENYRKVYKYDTALKNYSKSLKIVQEIGDKQGEGAALNNIGQIYHAIGDYETAYKYLRESLEISKEIGNEQGIGVALDNIGQIYHIRGDYDSALTYYKYGLEILKNVDKKGEGTALNSNGLIYYAKGDYDTALKYLFESLKVRREIGDKKGEGITLSNIGEIYRVKSDYESALKYLLESLKITREIGDKKQEGITLNNISQIHNVKGDHNSTLEYLLESLKIKKEIKDILGYARSLFNLAMLYKATGKTRESAKCLNEVTEINKTLKSYDISQKLKRNFGIEG
ncbi:MAG: tetratricopeptide repeat protein [Nitrospirae bacterium]|nr:tetratricopeptide repeat protein [Nitrospirota bacterium]MBF0534078.1 tetratricopeptide repeat protein [Nitrospirota bacterium]MBF0616237.1 tetratricopeptide repeat protein [Nitrospirota bacterium]